MCGCSSATSADDPHTEIFHELGECGRHGLRLERIHRFANAGLPLNTGVGEAVYPLEPQPMATALAEFVKDFGVRIVGGCCGTTPAHLDAVVKAVRSVEAAHPRTRHVPRVSSAMR